MTQVTVFDLQRRDAPVWSLGFRPFFLLGSLVAGLWVLAWALMQWGLLSMPPVTYPNGWHGHEMIFGFAGAGIVGFLFTAVANWTGVRTPHGRPLQVLVGLWLMARISPFFGNKLGLGLALVSNLGFWFWAGEQLRLLLWGPNHRHNRWFVYYMVLLGAGSALFYVGILNDRLDIARRGELWGLDVILMIVSHLGGRVIPMFTSRAVPSALVKSNPVLEKILPWTFMGYAWIHLLLGGHLVTALAGLVLGTIWAIRWVNWDPLASKSVPILWVLHSACFWMILGFLLKGVWFFWPGYPEGVWIHSFTVGTIGILIYGMMTRVALGHTGRQIGSPPRGVVVGYYLLNMAAAVRVGIPMIQPAYNTIAVSVAGALWVSAFLTYFWIYGPWLMMPSADGRLG